MSFGNGVRFRKSCVETNEQAEAFAMQIKDKCKFSSDRADQYQIVRGGS